MSIRGFWVHHSHFADSDSGKIFRMSERQNSETSPEQQFCKNDAKMQFFFEKATYETCGATLSKKCSCDNRPFQNSQQLTSRVRWEEAPCHASSAQRK